MTSLVPLTKPKRAAAKHAAREEIALFEAILEAEGLGPIDDEALVPRDGENLLPRGQVVEYAGSPGVRVACPACSYSGGRVGRWGDYACPNCGYRNTVARPTRKPEGAR